MSSLASPLPLLTLLEDFEANFKHQIILSKNILLYISFYLKIRILDITSLAYLKVNTNSLILSNIHSVLRSAPVSHKWLVHFNLFQLGSKHNSYIACGQCNFQVSSPAFFFSNLFLPCIYLLRKPVLSCRVSHILELADALSDICVSHGPLCPVYHLLELEACLGCDRLFLSPPDPELHVCRDFFWQELIPGSAFRRQGIPASLSLVTLGASTLPWSSPSFGGTKW